jgi:hypothetical protein
MEHRSPKEGDDGHATQKTTDILAKKDGDFILLIEYRAFNMHTIMNR